MFKLDFLFEDLSFTLASERLVGDLGAAVDAVSKATAFRMGLNSGGLARLGDSEFLFIVDVLARGELNVNEFSTNCWPSGGVITTLLLSLSV